MGHGHRVLGQLALGNPAQSQCREIVDGRTQAAVDNQHVAGRALAADFRDQHIPLAAESLHCCIVNKAGILDKHMRLAERHGRRDRDRDAQ